MTQSSSPAEGCTLGELQRWLGEAGARLVGDAGAGALRIVDVTQDSRQVVPGALFVVRVGRSTDGRRFVDDALRRGAVAVLCEPGAVAVEPRLEVGELARAWALAAHVVHGQPSRELPVIGVTGTNGKTTTTFMLRNILEEAGLRTEVLGTLSGERTTPEAPVLQRRLAAWMNEGVHAVAMEVSSHALALHRVDGMRYRVAVFTNLSRDHLDFHRNTEAYFEAKSRLFDPSLSRVAVVDLDDPYGRVLADTATISTTGFSRSLLGDVEVGIASCRFTWRGFLVEIPIGGDFNVANAHAAAEAAVALGIAAEVVARGLNRPLVVPGRFELIDAGQPFAVVVDYAHTPDGLERLLSAARAVSGAGRVTVVFGCGGDRDRSKRPMMGEVAARLADRVILTADNSRGEDTGAIVSAIREGFDHVVRGSGSPELVIEHDREAAIRTAVESAGEGDVVLIAGKGHETTQTIGNLVVPFDDRVVVRSILNERFSNTGNGIHTQ